MISKSNPVHLSIILALVNYISAHSWIDCVDVKEDHSCGGYIRGYDGHIDLHQTYKLLGRPNDSPICSPGRQAHPDNYDDQYPRAVAEPGDTLKFFYLENGHVTKDRLAPDGRPNPKQYTIHWTGKPYTGDRLEGTQIMTRGELGPHNQLGSAQNFDDGKCAEDNTRGRAGPLPCQGKLTLPSGIAPGIYQFIWFWKFDKDFKGIGEEYTSCFDIEVTPKGAKSTYVSKQQSKKEAYLPRPYVSHYNRTSMDMSDEVGTFTGSSRLTALPKFSMEDIHASGSMSRNDIPSNPPSDRVWQQLIGEIRAASLKPQAPVQVPAQQAIQAASQPVHQAPAVRIPQQQPQEPAPQPIQAASQPMLQAPAVRMPQPPASASMPPSAPQPLPAVPQQPVPRMPQFPASAQVQAQAIPASPQVMPQMQPSVASTPVQKAPSANSQLNAQSASPIANTVQQPMSANTAPSTNSGDVNSRAAGLQPAPAKAAAVPQANTQQQQKSIDAQAAKMEAVTDTPAPQQRQSQSQASSKAANDEILRALPAERSSQKSQTVPNAQRQLSRQEVTEAEKNVVNLQNAIKGDMDSFKQSQTDMISQSDPNYDNSRLIGRPEQEFNTIPSRNGEEMLTEDDIYQESVLTDHLLEEDPVPSWNSAATRSGQRLRIPSGSEQMERFTSPDNSQLSLQEAGPLSRQDLEIARAEGSVQPHQHHHSEAPERFEMDNQREPEPRFRNSNEGSYPFQLNGDSDLVERTKPFRDNHEDSQFNDDEVSQRMRPHMHQQEELNDNIPYPPPHEHHHSANDEPHQHHHKHGEAEARNDHQHQTESEPRHDHHHETERSDDQVPQGRMLGFPGAQPPVPPMPQGPHVHGPQELNDPRLAQARMAPFPSEQPQMMPPMPMPMPAPAPMPIPPQAQGQPIPMMRSAPGLRPQGVPRVPGRTGKLRASGSEDEMSSEESEEGEDLLSETADNEASGANMEETSSMPSPADALSEMGNQEKSEILTQKPGPHSGPKIDSHEESDMENLGSSADNPESTQTQNTSNSSLHASSKLVDEESEDDMELPASKSHNAPLVDETEHDLSLAPEVNHSKPLMDESEQEMPLPLSRGHTRPLVDESEENSPLTPEIGHNKPLMEGSEQESSSSLSIGHTRPLVDESEQDLPLAHEVNHKIPLMEESEELPAPQTMTLGKPASEDTEESSSMIPPMNPAKPLGEETQQLPTPSASMNQARLLHEDLVEESPALPAIDTQIPSASPHQTNVNTMEAIPDATNLQSPLPESINTVPAAPAPESIVEPQIDSIPISAQPAAADTLVAPQSEQTTLEAVLPE